MRDRVGFLEGAFELLQQIIGRGEERIVGVIEQHRVEANARLDKLDERVGRVERRLSIEEGEGNILAKHEERHFTHRGIWIGAICTLVSGLVVAAVTLWSVWK